MSLPRFRVVLTATLVAATMLLGLGAPAANAVQDVNAEQYMVELINAERRSAGLGTVGSFKDVRDVAYAWSIQMADDRRMYHNPSYHQQYHHWLRAAENVGWTTVSNPDDAAVVRAAIERLHKAFMNSDGHRANIMHPSHDHIGVGVEIRRDSCPSGVAIRDCMWITENFRHWDGTEPAGGLQDPYTGGGGRDSSGDGTVDVVINDKVYAGGFDGNQTTVERLGKAADSAVQISQARFDKAAADHAVLARDDAFADSLAGSPLTADGPLLYTASAALSSATKSELARVLPKGATVYLLGGTSALSGSVEKAVADLGFEPVRLAGTDRIATALKIADEVRRVYGDNDTVAIARAWGPPEDREGTTAWVDSITGGAWAAARTTPVLVSRTGELPPEVRNWLDRDKPRTSVILGGTAALSDKVAGALPGPKRVFGAERADTAAAVATTLWGVTPGSSNRKFVVIDGWAADGWRHGLAAAGLAADQNAPMLLSVGKGGDQPPATKSMVGSCNSSAVDVLMVGNVVDHVAGVLEALDGRSC